MTTGFDAQDVETSRAIVQAFAQNAPGRLSSIDFRRLLDRLGIPLLGWKAQQKQAEELATEAAQQGPPSARPSGGNAGVNEQGLYYEPRERITLTDDEEGFVARLLSRFRKKDSGPDPEVEDEDS